MSLLRAAMRYCLLGSSGASLAPLCRQVNWTTILWLGRQFRALLFLDHALRHAEVDLCPPTVRSQLDALREANQLRGMMLARELALLADLFVNEKIPTIAASDAAFAQRIPNLASLREVGPQSLYFVRSEDLPRAQAALAGAGYKLNIDRLRLSDRKRSHVAFRTQLGSGIAATALWRDAESLSLGGRKLLTLSDAQWLVHLSWEACQRFWPDFRSVFDLASIMFGRPQFEWEETFKYAAHLRREPALLLALDLCHRLMDVSAPPSVASRLNRWPAIRRQAEEMEKRILSGYQQPLEFWSILRGRLALQPNLARKMRCVWRHARFLAPANRGHTAEAEDVDGSIGLFSPTPPRVVTAMLRLAETGPTDIVCDIGCGDGRVVIAAVEQFDARGIGLDIDPKRIEDARSAAEVRGIGPRVRWHCGDFFQTDLSEATIVCLYLQGFAYPKIRRKLARELQPGARIVSHDFIFPGWPPEKTAIVRRAPDRVSQIYLWRLP